MNITELAGQRVGNYRLLKRCGKGSYGAVYEAEQLFDGAVALGRHVAVKVLNPQYLQGAGDIPAELRQAAELRHPGLVRPEGVPGSAEVVDASGHRSQVFWYAMELAEHSLADRLSGRDGKLSEAECLDVLRSIGEGLVYLHGMTPTPLVHRDIKPGNILKVDGVWKLADFGLLRPSAPEGYYSQPSGTTAYLPPEAWRDGSPIPAWDMWALGLTVLLACGAQHPAEGLAFPDWMALLAGNDPIALPGLPPRLAPIVEQCLCKRVAQRLTSVRLLEALEAPPPIAEIRSTHRSAMPTILFVGAGVAPLLAVVLGLLARTPTQPTAPAPPLQPTVSAPQSVPIVSAPPPRPTGSAAASQPTVPAPQSVPIVSAPPLRPTGSAAAPQPTVPAPLPSPIYPVAWHIPETVTIPAGRFLMGTPQVEKDRFEDEGPQHWVEIQHAFEVGKYPVTFDEWDACVADGGCRGYRPNDNGWGRGRHPVINVDWTDAFGYVTWLSGKTKQRWRLLSEAEWEYAARSGTITKYYWGDAIGQSHANCNDCGNALSNRTTPVGSFAANPFGLYDMAGNVWQWTWDCYNRDYGGAPADGSSWTTGDCSSRVVRGGSWSFDFRYIRSGYRGRRAVPDNRSLDIGFRVARTLAS